MNPTNMPARSHATSSASSSRMMVNADRGITPSDDQQHNTPALQLVLSLYPGADLLGRAFTEVGFNVVRGPDLILDERIEKFSVPHGRFDGVIGGPPCQHYSDANRNRNPAEGDRLVLEFLRVVDAARPMWFLMENVRAVPDVKLKGYAVQRLDCRDWEFGGRTGRLRHVQWGHREGFVIRPTRTESKRPVTLAPTLTTAPMGECERYSRRCARMNIRPLKLSYFKPAARRRMIGNGVPWSMGYSLALAVARRGPVTPNDCICGCGRLVTKPGTQANDACRQRMCRRRKGLGRVLEYRSMCPW